MLWGANWWPLISFVLLLIPPLLTLIDLLPAPVIAIGAGAFGLLACAFPWQADGAGVYQRASTALRPDGAIDWQEFARNEARFVESWPLKLLVAAFSVSLLVGGIGDLAQWY
jgi:hypothetical protein